MVTKAKKEEQQLCELRINSRTVILVPPEKCNEEYARKVRSRYSKLNGSSSMKYFEYWNIFSSDVIFYVYLQQFSQIATTFLFWARESPLSRRLQNLFNTPHRFIEIYYLITYFFNLLVFLGMQIEMIGTGAGILWNILNAQDDKMEIAKLKKESKLTDANFWASAGWLAKEGKLIYSSEKKGKKNVEYYTLVK